MMRRLTPYALGSIGGVIAITAAIEFIISPPS